MPSLSRNTLLMITFGALATAIPRASDGQVNGDSRGAPMIEFDRMSKDLGTVDEGIKKTFEFIVTNNGSGPLVISEVKGQCGCTNVRVDKSRLAPGESARLLGIFDTLGRTGRQRKSITVRSNDPARPIATLSFTALVKAKLKLTPRSLAFGVLDAEKLTSKALTVEFLDPQPVEIRKIEITNAPMFEASVVDRIVEVVKNEDDASTETRTKVTIRVECKSGVSLGRVVGRLLIHTSLAGKPPISVPISAWLMGDILARPSRIILRDVAAGGKATASVTLSSRRGDDFNITDVDPGELSLSWRIEPGKKAGAKILILELDVPEENKSPYLRGTIRISTDQAGRSASIDLDVLAVIKR